MQIFSKNDFSIGEIMKYEKNQTPYLSLNILKAAYP